jgi:hypothetical protein
MENAIQCRMTEKYDPYEDAAAERGDGILKQKYFFNTNHLNLEVMKKLQQESINVYNQKKPHYISSYKGQ